MRPLRNLLIGLFMLTIGAASPGLAANPPLHTAIDDFILQKADGIRPMGHSSDAEFLRRVTLDFSGWIPTAEETRAFLDDASPKKRQKLIDSLLAAPRYAERLADLFNVMLMERRGEDAEWRAWLVRSFAENKPWNQMAQELLDPDSEDETARASAFFMTKRLEKYGQNPTDFPGLTRDIGRLFLGFDLQCAECHDHLFISDYKQVDFQGLFTVYQNTFVRRDVKFPAIGEKAMTTPVEFVSVFDPTKQKIGPRIPLGKSFEIPEGIVPPKNPKTAPPRPEFSAVSLIARELTQTENRQFARNAVNRLWFVLLGRGIVHPLDLHHEDNAPSHPKLLERLTDDFIAHGHDVKWLLREIALSETYQRSSQLASPATEATLPAPSSFLVAIESRLSAEQLADSVLVATGELTRLTELKKNEKAADVTTKVAEEEEAEPELTLDAVHTAFKTAFANAAREPENTVNSTVKGALFWRNAVPIQQLLRRRPGNLVDRLAAQSDDRKMVEELYLSVLTRRPSDDESQLIVSFVAGDKDQRELAIRDAVWALLTSSEFYVNH